MSIKQTQVMYQHANPCLLLCQMQHKMLHIHITLLQIYINHLFFNFSQVELGREGVGVGGELIYTVTYYFLICKASNKLHTGIHLNNMCTLSQPQYFQRSYKANFVSFLEKYNITYKMYNFMSENPNLSEQKLFLKHHGTIVTMTSRI